ncbi:MAG: hypothetical protein IPG68_13005 [Micrococcales bacterium]|nr:hypothetical protein [Micrococcales bacterium]
MSWNEQGATGPQGNQGAQGPNLKVKDGTGATLGTFLGILPQGYPLLFVQIDGGAYTYTPSGLLYPLGIGSPKFKDNACTGAAYMDANSPLTAQLLTGSAGGPTRMVYRRTSPTLGPALAWQFTTTTENAVAVQLYELNSAGACVADGGPYNGTLVALSPVAAPPDVPGPLTIG